MKALKVNTTAISSSTPNNIEAMSSELESNEVKMTIDPREFRNACGAFVTGITVVMAQADGETQEMTANGFMSVSLDPALIMVSVGNNQKIHKIISTSGRYSVSILGASQLEFSNHFGGKPNSDLIVECNDNEKTPYLSQNIGYFVAKVKSSHIEGDHTLFIGEVEEFSISNHEDPLLYSRGEYKSIK